VDIYGTHGIDRRVLAATNKTKLYGPRPKSSGVRGVTVRRKRAGHRCGRGKAAVQRGTGHKALCFCFWLYIARIAGVVHAAAAANAAAVARLSVAASAAPAAARSDLVDWVGEVFVEFLGVDVVSNSSCL
jgi:hypothetical protein